MRVNILGVNIDDINMAEAVALVEKWVWNPGKHYIVTPNPEMIVAAWTDPLFKKILNDADLSIPDGSGLKLSGKIKNILAGTDFMERLVGMASEKGFTAGFLGGRYGVAKRCVECLLRKYPKLKVSFTSADTKTKIPPSDLLFVALGHLKQEKWIALNLEKIPVHVAMGVGGAFDYLSGDVSRAPEVLRGLGFEWLFRLFIQPWRIKRQLVLFKYLWLLLSYDYHKNP